MTGDKVTKDSMCFAHLSDLEMAGKVRMLFRDSLDHEAVITGARDRIMYLSQQLAAQSALTKEMAEALEVLAEWLDERWGDNECRPLENARAALAKYRNLAGV